MINALKALQLSKGYNLNNVLEKVNKTIISAAKSGETTTEIRLHHHFFEETVTTLENNGYRVYPRKGTCSIVVYWD